MTIKRSLKKDVEDLSIQSEVLDLLAVFHSHRSTNERVRMWSEYAGRVSSVRLYLSIILASFEFNLLIMNDKQSNPEVEAKFFWPATKAKAIDQPRSVTEPVTRKVNTKDLEEAIANVQLLDFTGPLPYLSPTKKPTHELAVIHPRSPSYPFPPSLHHDEQDFPTEGEKPKMKKHKEGELLTNLDHPSGRGFDCFELGMSMEAAFEALHPFTPAPKWSQLAQAQEYEETEVRYTYHHLNTLECDLPKIGNNPPPGSYICLLFTLEGLFRISIRFIGGGSKLPASIASNFAKIHAKEPLEKIQDERRLVKKNETTKLVIYVSSKADYSEINWISRDGPKTVDPKHSWW